MDGGVKNGKEGDLEPIHSYSVQFCSAVRKLDFHLSPFIVALYSMLSSASDLS